MKNPLFHIGQKIVCILGPEQIVSLSENVIPNPRKDEVYTVLQYQDFSVAFGYYWIQLKEFGTSYLYTEDCFAAVDDINIADAFSITKTTEV